MMTNDTNLNPIFLFRDFSKNFGAVFGVASNEDKYKSLFLINSDGVEYTDMPKDIASQRIQHDIMEIACIEALRVIVCAPDTVVSDDIVPYECRRHHYFNDDGLLNHINPDLDGQWIRITGVTPEDIEDAFIQLFCDAYPP